MKFRTWHHSYNKLGNPKTEYNENHKEYPLTDLLPFRKVRRLFFPSLTRQCRIYRLILARTLIKKPLIIPWCNISVGFVGQTY